MKVSRFLSPSLKILVTVMLLALVFRAVDVTKIRHGLSSLDGRLLAQLLVVCWIGQLACAQRWRLLSAGLEMRGGYFSFVQLYFVGMLFNMGLPSLVGGDFVKAYILSRKTAKPFSLGLASVLQDRAAGLTSLLVYGTAAILLHPISWRGIPLWLVYGATWLVFVAGLLLAWKGEGIYEPFLKRDAESILKKLLRMLAGFHIALGTMKLSVGAGLQVAGFSFLNSAIVFWMYQQVSVAVGHPVDFLAFSALLPLITLVTMIPISLGGLGVREWTYVEALRLLGVPSSSALLIALATSALILALNLIGIFFLPAIPSELRPHGPSAPGREGGKGDFHP